VTGPARVRRARGGQIEEGELRPEDFGVETCAIEDRRGGGGPHNAAVARDLLDGKAGPIRDAVLLNSAAALVAFDGFDSQTDLVAAMRSAVERAAAAIDDGSAARLLEKWAEFSVARS